MRVAMMIDRVAGGPVVVMQFLPLYTGYHMPEVSNSQLEEVFHEVFMHMLRS